LCCPEDFPFDGNVIELLDFAEDAETYSRSVGFVRRIDDMAREKRIRHRQILHVVSEAIKNDGIEMYYQPIYSLEQKKFTNAEALVRLKDNDTIGFISPEEFIPLSEKKGMIMPLSSLIFNHVFNFMSENNLKRKGVNHIEVNLSGLQSVDANLPKLMKSLLMKHNIAPDCVNLEITESIAVTSGYMLKKNMDELRKFGCSFSMDDFGTGYSNLSRIAKADFEMIKIDKSLLWPCFK
jgi:EAL domain-containing protein (putative c-di-GMP-specific phosphodiesterase class I)